MIRSHYYENLSKWEIFSILFSISFLSLLFTGYRFGVGDQTGHLTYLLKSIQPFFFISDPKYFATNCAPRQIPKKGTSVFKTSPIHAISFCM